MNIFVEVETAKTATVTSTLIKYLKPVYLQTCLCKGDSYESIRTKAEGEL